MKLAKAIVAGLAWCASASSATPPSWAPTAGDVYEIRQEYQTEDKSDDGGSGSSNGHTTIIERVIAVRDDGMELEYDLPVDATAQDRARQWQFPARVFRPFNGTPQLLNIVELESRVDAWLKLGKITRDACGKWIFTWNAFKIECDPQSVIASMEPYNLWLADLHDGAPYRAPGMRDVATLKVALGRSPVSYVAEMEVDPDTVRNERAEADVVVAQIMGKPITKEVALQARAAEIISGTITVSIDTDSSGKAQRRTTQAQLNIKGADGKTETQLKTEKVERTLVSPSAR